MATLFGCDSYPFDLSHAMNGVRLPDKQADLFTINLDIRKKRRSTHKMPFFSCHDHYLAALLDLLRISNETETFSI
ncbi:hypothetical protein AAC387_Pa05g3636 [Persea americana]